MRLIIASIVAFLLSAGLIRTVLLAPAIRRQLVANPADDRWHTRPTPSLGGVPMFVGFSAAMIVTGGLSDRVGLALFAGAGILFAIGLVDDIRNISPRAKLAGQLSGAVILSLLAGGSFQLSLIRTVLVVAWIVLISNSVNLIDNMDGLAASTTVISLVILLPLLVGAQQDSLALAAAGVVGALAGFLLFNLNPAKVFMGDAGSLWLGLILATVAALADYGDRRLPPLAVMTILAIPLLDTGTVVLSRLRRGLSIMRGGKDHLSHRLVQLGLSDRHSVLVLAGATAVSGLAAIAEPLLPTAQWVLLISIVWVGLIVSASSLLRVPVYQDLAAD